MINIRSCKGSCTKALCGMLSVMFLIGILCWKAWNKFCSYIEEDNKHKVAETADYAVVDDGVCIIIYKKLNDALIYRKKETVDAIVEQLMSSGKYTSVTQNLHEYY